VPTFRPGPRYYYTEEGVEAAKGVYEKIYKPKNPGPDDWTKKLVFGPATEAPDVADNVLYDGQVADRAVESLRELAKSDEPFFLAVGFIKPHSPYIAPKKFFDLYDPESIPLADPVTLKTDGIPAIAMHGSGELRRYTDQQKRGPIPEADQRRVRHAYLACISYIDAQIGRVLAELEKQGLTGNTIVALWSDHGYHLGEKSLWGKTTNFEMDTRVPLIIRIPGKEPGVHKSPVELVDLYPTLADLAGLPVGEQLQGTSLSAAIENPALAVKSAAFSQFSRGSKRGYSIRTKTHRYTEWIDFKTGQVTDRMLFDHRSDPHESRNLIDSGDPFVPANLSHHLSRGEGWRMAGIATKLTLGKPFTDQMVLQRDRPNRIWGKAPPGEEIVGTFPWGQLFSRSNENGFWVLNLPAFGASTRPETITIRSESGEVQMNDVLFGDVWICSGQSNMRWKLNDSLEAEKWIAEAEKLDLQILNLEPSIHPGGVKFPLGQLRNTFADNVFESPGWEKLTAENAGDFSAVAFHFGRFLREYNPDGPIGLICNAVGGSPMEAWIPGESRNPNWLENAELPKWVAGRARHNLTNWIEAGSAAPTPHHPFEPGFLFDAGVRPFTKLPVRGVLWYQGESDATEDGAGSPPIDPKKNFAIHRRLIESWRMEFGDEKLPFYFVQLPGLNRDWPAFREVQQQVDLLVPNTHMAVTLDAGHPTNVHPKNKRPVGERLARLVLKHDFRRSVVADAPRLIGWV
ncbi:MAG: sulfatase-like hydrolase/transferase, partial [Verrucomicrobiales bacterium]|nr:sulfatase-like hydrolase/transferase [Verrucomicrobiales bacterium]